MNVKKYKWWFIITAMVLFVGLTFYFNRDYTNNNNSKLLQKKALGLIQSIKNHSYQLQSTIQEVQNPITSQTIRAFNPNQIQRRSLSLVKEFKEERLQSPYYKKKLKNGLLFIRKSLVSYELALKSLEARNYPQAKIKLQFVNFYADKASKILLASRSFNFVNPFRSR